MCGEGIFIDRVVVLIGCITVRVDRVYIRA